MNRKKSDRRLITNRCWCSCPGARGGRARVSISRSILPSGPSRPSRFIVRASYSGQWSESLKRLPWRLVRRSDGGGRFAPMGGCRCREAGFSRGRGDLRPGWCFRQYVLQPPAHLLRSHQTGLGAFGAANRDAMVIGHVFRIHRRRRPGGRHGHPAMVVAEPGEAVRTERVGDARREQQPCPTADGTAHCDTSARPGTGSGGPVNGWMVPRTTHWLRTTRRWREWLRATDEGETSI